MSPKFLARFAPLAPYFNDGAASHLWNCYTQEGRHYHTQHHILALTALLNQLQQLAQTPQAVLAAIYFHDAIYEIPCTPDDKKPHDNEEKSAQLLLAWAKNPSDPICQKAAALIRMTATHHVEDASDADMALMHDLDLSILATKPATFALFEQNIRREYQIFSDDIFNSAHAHFLEKKQQEDPLYLVPTLQKKWGPRAMSNMAEALRKLRPY